ncbi:MAG: hypothetical protein AMJ46_12730 [Latescibacteria bacterium DG_63]|nr:MAG: hypothetical protein AMJ46_12730 [Latescibacteria bacterium DG_63]
MRVMRDLLHIGALAIIGVTLGRACQEATEQHVNWPAQATTALCYWEDVGHTKLSCLDTSTIPMPPPTPTPPTPEWDW